MSSAARAVGVSLFAAALGVAAAAAVTGQWVLFTAMMGTAWAVAVVLGLDP